MLVLKYRAKKIQWWGMRWKRRMLLVMGGLMAREE
jgi:hypothetical protein